MYLTPTQETTMIRVPFVWMNMRKGRKSEFCLVIMVNIIIICTPENLMYSFISELNQLCFLGHKV